MLPAGPPLVRLLVPASGGDKLRGPGQRPGAPRRSQLLILTANQLSGPLKSAGSGYSRAWEKPCLEVRQRAVPQFFSHEILK